MRHRGRVAFTLTLLALLVFACLSSPASADQIRFSLAPGESVTLGSYTLVYTGMAGGLPAYELYVGASLVARFPSSALAAGRAEYWFGNGTVGIATSGVTANGSGVNGTFTVR